MAPAPHSLPVRRTRVLLLLGLLLTVVAAPSAFAQVTAPPGVSTPAPSSSSVRIAWQPVAGATGYRVSRGPSGTGPWSSIGAPAGPALTDTGRTPATTYWYTVQTVAAGQTSARSTPVAGTTRPAAPAGLAASGTGSTRVHLGWPASLGASGYQVVRASAAGAGAVVLGSPSGPSYDDDTASPGTAYRYSVLAVGVSGTSTASPGAGATTAAAPDAGAPPSGLAVRGLSSATAGLTWSPLPGATGYDVLRSATPAGPFTRVRSQSGTTWTDGGRAAGTRYAYAVRAVTPGGRSGTSAAVEATTATAPRAPASPAAPSPRPTSATSVALTWPAVPGAAAYRVLRAAVPGGTYAPVGSPSTPSFTDRRVVAGSTSSWVVRAVSAAGTSGTSVAAVASTPGDTRPAIPAGLRAAPSSPTSVSLSWDASSGADGYVVTRTPAGTRLAVPSGTTLEDTALEPATSYAYTVSATNAAGTSLPSPAVVVTTPVARDADAVAPGPVTAVQWTATGSAVTLAWSPPGDPDLAASIVRRSTGSDAPAGPAEGDPVAVPAGASGVRDGGLEPDTTYSYAVFATDTSGNTGPGSTVTARTGPPETVPVAGVLSRSTTWSPDRASAYHLTGDVTVAPGVVLTLAPGTVVAAAPGVALRVQGELRAPAGPAAAVLTSDRDPAAGLAGTTASSAPPGPGDWAGVDVQPGATGTPALDLHGVRVAYATTGVSVRRAAVAVTDSLLEHLSGSGVDVRSPVGAPVVRHDAVEHTAGTAIGLTGAALDLSQLDGNTGTDDGVAGVVLSASTVAVDATLPWSGNLPPVLGPGCRALTVPAGVGLVLGPGAVVKSMSPDCGYLSVAGSLTAQGSEQEPVVLTSWRDDSVAGDTNGDGAATRRAAGGGGGGGGAHR